MEIKQGYMFQCYPCLLMIPSILLYSYCDKVSVHYSIFPEAGLSGLRCLSDNVEFRRPVRFNSTTNVCEMLDQQWSANSSYDPGYSYMTMISFEEPFTENFTARSWFPDTFDDGCHFEVIFKTPNSNLRWFSFKIVDWTSSVNTTFMQVYFKPSRNETTFRSRYFGNWSEETIASNPFLSRNTLHRATVHLYETHWSVFLDSHHLINFTHHFTFCCKPLVHFWSNDVLCQRIVFYGP